MITPSNCYVRAIFSDTIGRENDPMEFHCYNCSETMNTDDGSPKPATLPSSQEVLAQEEVLMKYFSGLIQASFGTAQSTKRTNGHMKVHWRVSSTAIVFFRQFYLKNNLLQHDPRIIMLAAVFLAGKVEECRVGMRDLLEVYDKCTTENIKACELLLIEALDFNLDVKHPQSYVHTLIADYKRLSFEMDDSRTKVASSSNSKKSSSNDGITAATCQVAFLDAADEASDFVVANLESATRREWSIAAESALITLQQSNAALLYSPLVIAVSALKLTEPVGELAVTFSAYMQRRFGVTANLLLEHYEALEVMVETARVPVDLVFLKTICMERLKKESVWSKAKIKKPKKSAAEVSNVFVEQRQADEIPMDVS